MGQKLRKLKNRGGADGAAGAAAAAPAAVAAGAAGAGPGPGRGGTSAAPGGAMQEVQYPALDSGPLDWSDTSGLSDFWQRPWVVEALARYRGGFHDFGAMNALDLDTFMLVWSHLTLVEIVRCFRVCKSFLAALSDVELWRQVCARIRAEDTGADRHDVLEALSAVDHLHMYRDLCHSMILVRRKPAMYRLKDAHPDGVGCMHLDANASILITGGKDDTVALWDASGLPLQPVMRRELMGKWVWGVYMDDAVVLTCSRDRKLRLFTRAGFATGAGPAHIETESAALTALACDGRVVYTACLNQSVRGWRIAGARLEPVHTLAGHTLSVFSVAMDERWVLSGSKDETVRVWDRGTGAELAVLAGHGGMVRAVQFQHTEAVSGSADGLVRLWDLRSHTQTGVLAGHPYHVKALVRRQHVLLSAAKDGKVCVWDLRHPARPVQRLHGHAGAVYGLVLCGPLLLSCCLGGEVRLWDFGRGVALADADRAGDLMPGSDSSGD